MVGLPHDVDDYYICRRLKLKGETENMGVCTKERKGDTAEVLMAGSGRPSMLMLVRSAAALATMRPVLLLRVL